MAKIQLGDKVKFIKDIDLPNYPKTATSLIKMSKSMLGKVFEIVSIRSKGIDRKPTKHCYGFYGEYGLTYCTAEELEVVKE